MIDFHSHILPGVDDGSRDVYESLEMLRVLKKQGIDTVVATPHFYADNESLDSFIDRRNHAASRLRAKICEDLPKILCGAEVKYYPGIEYMHGKTRLCIEGTKLFLLEMPMSKWTEYTVKELMALSQHEEITVVIAHMERYMGFQDIDAVRRIYESGILIQCNADFFLRLTSKKRALSMFGAEEIHFIGSDCHNLTSRSPKIGNAYNTIEKKFGRDFLEEYQHYCRAHLFPDEKNV